MELVHKKMSAWDDDYFDQLCAIHVPLFHGSHYLEAKKSFLSDLLTEPPLVQQLGKQFDDLAEEYKINILEERIFKSTSLPSEVSSLYLDKLNELRSKLRLYRLLRTSIVLGINNRTESVREIENIYGVPSYDVFNHLRLKLREQYLKQTFPVIRSYHYRNLAPIFDDIPQSSVTDLEVVISASDKDDSVPITNATTVRKYIISSLRNLEISGWTVEYNKIPYGNFRVSPKRKKIIVPNTNLLMVRKGERQLTEKRLEAIVEHEISTHVLRSVNGGKTPLKLLSVGLAGYLHGEEGIATVREQEVLGATDYASPNTYFALGIAYGLDRGGEKRSFLETFKVLHDYFYVIGGLSGANSKSKAFAACYRLYRGATGSGTSVILTKDRVYREGNIAIYKLLTEFPERKSWFDVGKFDPTNGRHVRLLTDLSLLPN